MFQKIGQAHWRETLNSRKSSLRKLRAKVLQEKARSWENRIQEVEAQKEVLLSQKAQQCTNRIQVPTPHIAGSKAAWNHQASPPHAGELEEKIQSEGRTSKKLQSQSKLSNKPFLFDSPKFDALKRYFISSDIEIEEHYVDGSIGVKTVCCKFSPED